MSKPIIVAAVVLTACLGTRAALADNPLGGDEGKFLLTAGFNDVEGAAGGGLVPMAVITGYESNGSWGANAHFTSLQMHDFTLHTYGAAVGLFDRAELTFTKQELEITGTALDGLGVRQHVVGLKVKLVGDAVYGQDSWLPQVSVGAQYKKNEGLDDADHVGLAGVDSVTQLGARKDSGIDYYLAATKVLLSESLLTNVSLRYTKANQFGLLGFGGDRHDDYSVRPELTLAYLLTRRIALGGEWRSRPHNLSIDNETNAWDVFAGWTPTKNLSVVLAYVNVGSILAPVTTVNRRQDGAYISVQAGF